MMTPTDRICELAFAPITDVIDWLRTFPNLTITEPRPGTFQVRREDGFMCGLMELAPID